MEDDLNKNGKQPQKKMKDDLNKNGRRPKKKMEDKPINRNQPNWL